MDALVPPRSSAPPREEPGDHLSQDRRLRPFIFGLVVLGGVALAWGLGIHDILRMENLATLRRWVEGYGPRGPALFISGYVLLEMAFVPALPLTVLGGVVFGPVWGTAYVSIASTLGAALAFLIARYAARGAVDRWVARHPRLARLDTVVAEHGWRILVITRLVPIFPFNLQNFAYGVTRIPFWQYVWLSWLCMLPGTVAYTLAASTLSAGGRDPQRILASLGIAGILIVLVSLLPRWLMRRSHVPGDLLEGGISAENAARGPGLLENHSGRPGPGRESSGGTPEMLSIIIPTLNEAERLEELLHHLRAVCPGAEVIVVDGGSGDGSRDLVRRFPRVRLLSTEPGRARQMNAGAEVAQGEVLLFLHADTRLPDGAHAAVTDAVADPAVVGGRFDVRFDNPRPVFRAIAALMNLRSRVTGIFTGDQAIFVKREVFAALGGYPDIPLMEDVELTRRLKRQGRLACLRLRVTTSARRWEQEGVLRTILLMWSFRLLFFLGIGPERLHRWYYRTPCAPARGKGLGSPATTVDGTHAAG